ncbi:hypothetical protein O988_01071 [Pseudogymnoascus sp. VKM F-3808]|nr:hypothetical protein O988_01071 [Pseudogymnoascus sp. VKM F-3808]
MDNPKPDKDSDPDLATTYAPRDSHPQTKKAEASDISLCKNQIADHDIVNPLSSHSPHAQATEVDREAHGSGTEVSSSDNEPDDELSSYSPHAQATEVDREAHGSGDDLLMLLDEDEDAFRDIMGDDLEEDVALGPDDENYIDGEYDSDPDDISINEDEVKASAYPFSYSFWFLLRQVSVDDFMAVYVTAIPRRVQVVLGQNKFTPEAILSVDRDWRHHNCGGVYINLSKSKDMQEYGCYIGSTTRAFSTRIMEHIRVASKYSPDTLPDMYSSSLHYNHICKLGVVSNFRVLAAFRDRDIPRGYIFLLEAALMVMTRSLCNKTFQKYNNPEFEEFIRDVQVKASMPWLRSVKLNLTWPVVMGFRMDRKPCENTGCPVKANYNLMSSGQKLSANQDAARALAGPNPKCGDCAREESGLVHRLHVHRLYPTVLLCYSCWQHCQAKGMRRTLENAKKALGRAEMSSKRKDGTLICGNCSVPDNSMSRQQQLSRHSYLAPAGMVLCIACHAYYRREGRHRDPALEAHLRFTTGINTRRASGEDINCSTCGKLELSGPGNRKFHCSDSRVLCGACYSASRSKTPEERRQPLRAASKDLMAKRKEGDVICENCFTKEPADIKTKCRYMHNAATGKVLCTACVTYYNNHGEHRDPSREILRQAREKLRAKRATGTDIHCTNCTKVEDQGKPKFVCIDADMVLCRTCYARRNNGKRKESNT